MNQLIPQTRKRYATEQEHPAYKIFHWLFEIWVPQAFTVELDDAIRFGTPTTGDKAYDAELAKELTRVMWSISKMAMKVNDGAPITLATPSDAMKIHGIIVEYLQCWADELEHELAYLTPEQVRGNPIYVEREKDMAVLQGFADLVYPVAKSQMPAQLQPSSLAGRLKALGGRINDNYGAAQQPPVASAEAPTALSEGAKMRTGRGAARWR